MLETVIHHAVYTMCPCYTYRTDDSYLNSKFNSISIDIDKCELDSRRNISDIIVFIPP